jgi:hypothetical protein
MEVKVALGCLKAKAGRDWLEAKTPIRLTPPGRAAFRSASTPVRNLPYAGSFAIARDEFDIGMADFGMRDFLSR